MAISHSLAHDLAAGRFRLRRRSLQHILSIRKFPEIWHTFLVSDAISCEAEQAGFVQEGETL